MRVRTVSAYDPEAMEKAKSVLPNITYCSDPYQAAEGADAIVIVTEWDEFRQVDWDRLAFDSRTAPDHRRKEYFHSRRNQYRKDFDTSASAGSMCRLPLPQQGCPVSRLSRPRLRSPGLISARNSSPYGTSSRPSRYSLPGVAVLAACSPGIQSVPILMYHSISDEDESNAHAYYRTKTSPWNVCHADEILARDRIQNLQPGASRLRNTNARRLEICGHHFR